MKVILASLIATLLLSGCHSVQIEQQEEQQARLDRVLDGFSVLDANEIKEWESPRYDVLRKHMVNNTDNITPGMLVSDIKPATEEKDAIFEWANFGMEINKERIQLAKEYLTHDYVERFDSLLFSIIGIRLRLYEGNISYGEYLAELKELDGQFRKDLLELTRHHSELVAKAQRRRLEQKERWMRTQERMHERRQEDGKRYGPLRCDDIGDFTRCRF